MSKPELSHASNRLDHKTLEKYEGIWLGIAVVMVLLLFAGVIASMINGTFPLLAGQGGGHAMVNTSGRVDPVKVGTGTSATPFDKPGFTADGNDLYIVARAFQFAPAEVRVPAGKEINVHVTSADVIHGFQITGTNINAEILPGHVATYTVTFKHPGTQHVICNEFCGAGHQNMVSTFIIEEKK